jgi:pimeloyl-ACP methyl ester carboxylesterase
MMESRAVFELGAFLAASPMLRCLGRGDRHPVLVLPGFTGDDRSTEPLRWFLRSQGFWAHAWHLGPNLGPTTRTLDGLSERLGTLHDRHGMQVTVVGWSLGGIYARHLARLHPEMVRQVITLGSPFRMREGDKSAATPLWDALSPGFAVEMAGMLVPEADKPPLTVPATAIYTRSDGVVRWWTCLESEGPTRENIEVRGSHSGLGFNPAALYAVADRLAQPDGTWTPFRAPIGMRHLYPKAATFRSREPVAA